MKNEIKSIKSELAHVQLSKSLSWLLLLSFFLGLALILLDSTISSILKSLSVKLPDGVFCAIGSSIVGSLFFFFIYSIFSERRNLEDIATRVSDSSLKLAHQLYQSRFENYVPKQFFEYVDNRKPDDEFDKSFKKKFLLSNRYLFRGGSGTFAVERLSRYLSNGVDCSQMSIKFCLLSVDQQYLDFLVKNTERYKRDGEAETKKKISESVIKLCKIAQDYSIVDFKLYLSKSFPIYRVEQFDDSMFIAFFHAREDGYELLFTQQSENYRFFSKLVDMEMKDYNTEVFDLNNPSVRESIASRFIDQGS